MLKTVFTLLSTFNYGVQRRYYYCAGDRGDSVTILLERKSPAPPRCTRISPKNYILKMWVCQVLVISCKPWIVKFSFSLVLHRNTRPLTYFDRDFNCSLSKEIPYRSSTRDDISDQLLPMFFCSFMKASKPGVVIFFLFRSQSVKAPLRISETPLPSFSAIPLNFE